MFSSQVIRVYFLVFILVYSKTLAAGLMFCSKYEKKPQFALRFLLSVAAALLFLFILNQIFVVYNLEVFGLPIFYTFIPYLLIHCCVFINLLILYNRPVVSILFSMIGGHSIAEITMCVFYLLTYQFGQYYLMEKTSVLYYIPMFIWYVIVFTLYYNIFIKKGSDPIAVNGKQPALYISLVIYLFLIQFNNLRVNFLEKTSVMDYACLLATILFYVIILLLRSNILYNSFITQELALSQNIWAEKEKSLKITSDAINTINTKYHDLKYMVKGMPKGDATRDSLKAITESMKVYGDWVSCGNDTLDMILSEENVLFKQNNILFSCICDGSVLDFMTSLDIISVFYNGLDNAFEAVMKLPEDERQISLSVKEKFGMVSIIMENPYLVQPDIRDNVVYTSKDDSRYHGFGIASMRSVVSKYNGALDISTEHNIFKASILIPRE